MSESATGGAEHESNWDIKSKRRQGTAHVAWQGSARDTFEWKYCKTGD